MLHQLTKKGAKVVTAERFGARPLAAFHVAVGPKDGHLALPKTKMEESGEDVGFGALDKRP